MHDSASSDSAAASSGHDTSGRPAPAHDSEPGGGAEARLDVALTQRGLSRSRSHAARLIAAGHVTVDDEPALKASQPIRPDQSIEVAVADHYVSRAAHKLIAALDSFGIGVAGRLALDVGASTGGFTQVLLERGATRVIALDVGHGQLAEQIRTDPRVDVIEGVNARYLTRDILNQAIGTGVLAPDAAPLTGTTTAMTDASAPTLVVADLSFISLGQVLPALLATAAPGADFVVLVKPQFEVGRTGIKEGLVRDPALRADAISGVLWSAWDLGLKTAGLTASPLAGSTGNREYLAWLSADVGGNPTEWMSTVSQLAHGASPNP